MPTSVFIALAEPFTRIGIESTLAVEQDFAVVGHADLLEDVAAGVARLRPDILILDSHFQQRDPHVMRTLRERHPDCRVLVLVDHTDEECTIRRLLAGPRERWPEPDVIHNLKECCLLAFRESARGCLPKASTPDRLLGALRAIREGEVWAGPGLSKYLVELMRPEAAPPSPALTKRELDVVVLMTDGLSNKGIADRLGLSEQTVKNHVARIMNKVGVRNRVELAIYAVRERLA